MKVIRQGEPGQCDTAWWSWTDRSKKHKPFIVIDLYRWKLQIGWRFD